MSESPWIELVSADPNPSVFDMRPRLSMAELIAVIFFVYLTLAAFVGHLAASEVAFIIALDAVTLATLLALRRKRQRARWLAGAADLFPALLLMVAYRESGLLLTPDPAHHLDYVLVRWDRVLLQNHFVQTVLQAGAPWLQHYLELAYMLCYPLVPLGVGAIHWASHRNAANATPPSAISGVSDFGSDPDRTANRTGRQVPTGSRRYDGSALDGFWAAVLLATLFCYAVYPFFPLTPPRVLFADVPGPHVAPLLRNMNSWLLDHYSVQACVFPSAHVAAVTAVGLAVRKHAPRLGALFLFLAASVAVATVYGRYHYAADAVAGTLVGAAAYKLSQRIR
jgi:membrane-associated phospholipid phosphatase